MNVRTLLSAVLLSSLSLPALAAPARVVSHQPAPSVAPTAARSASAAQALDPTQWGPYGVGVKTYEFEDVERGRVFKTEVWYPAINSEDNPGEVYYGGLVGRAERDAPRDLSVGEAPLLAFSHGSGGIRVQSIFFTEFMASHGYVVIAPDHQGNTMFDYDDTASARAAVDRPLDITFATDRFMEFNDAPDHFFAGSIDPDRMAMSGHSYGGYTTRMICGAQASLEVARTYCDAGDNFYCEAVSYAESLFGAIDWLDLRDDRFKAGVAMAPGLYDLFTDEGTSHVAVPLADLASELDQTLPYATDGLPLHQATPSPKYLLTMFHRGHFAYSSAWDFKVAAGQRCDTWQDCQDRDPGHAIINTYSAAFLEAYLNGDMSQVSYLEADYAAEQWAHRASSEPTP